MEQAELADVLKLLRMKLEGISKATNLGEISDASCAQKSNVQMAGVAIASSFAGLSGRHANQEMGGGFSPSHNPQIFQSCSLSSLKMVDFDYFRYTVFNASMTLDQELSLSYIRKRFKLCLARFFQKLKRSFVLHGITDQHEIKGKGGFQMLNLLKGRLSLSIDEECKLAGTDKANGGTGENLAA